MSFLYVKIICYKNVSYFQPIFLIPAKTDYIIGCKSDTNIDEKEQVMQSEAKKRSEKMQGCGRKIPALIFCAAAVLCIVIWVMRHARMQEGNEPDVVASRCENNVYDLTVAANCDEIKDAESNLRKKLFKNTEKTHFAQRSFR